MAGGGLFLLLRKFIAERKKTMLSPANYSNQTRKKNMGRRAIVGFLG
jgi:hypothetical protein